MLKDWNRPQQPNSEELGKRLTEARRRLAAQQTAIKKKNLPVLVLMEGWGASGKGSVLGKIIRNIDPRFFKVATMDMPTEEERRKPFLYRFFVRIPEAGKFMFLDGGWLDEVTRSVLKDNDDKAATR